MHSVVLTFRGVVSVRLSVTLVDCDHMGYKFWKLIARAISRIPWLFQAQTPSTYTPRGTWGNMGKTKNLTQKPCYALL